MLEALIDALLAAIAALSMVGGAAL